MLYPKLLIKMDTATEKLVKEQINEAKQSFEGKEIDEKTIEEKEISYTGNSDGDGQAQKSLKQIQDMFQKTEAMKLEATVKNKELEDQFKILKQRLNSSSEYLCRIKNNIENIKFSYQRNVMELQKTLDPATEIAKNEFEKKEDMAKYMEEIRHKIDDLQNRMTTQREKQQHVTESYEEAFDKVISALQRIDSGAYASSNLGNADDDSKCNDSNFE